MLGKPIDNKDSDISYDPKCEYYKVFKQVYNSQDDLSESIKTGLEMDLDRFNNFYTAITGMTGGRLYRKRSTTNKNKKKSNKKRRSVKRSKKGKQYMY